ncbi:MAG: 2-amino-4-hydroxy-6-hydroxymethyldihydropteridine diphosphokinase [Prevotella sp.]|nr:2-amino-4-hydroxy-6-hydroxymethyldihydropteridine diphosphokinase [Prevotella sp.]
MTKHQVYLGLGTNLGDRASNILRAIQLIGERVGTVVRQSSLIETEPWGFESPNKFLNAVILCETERTPREVLRLTQKIERDMGRRKKTSLNSIRNATLSKRELSSLNYSDRPIDIDILLYDDMTVDEPDLKIPHPLMYERDFVMIPLNEIKHIEITTYRNI